ncbi:adhesion regulating molecule [Punctularia strigosozonata HHB-11173 SS5]|uniref:adhesion regulating molecule n=1 Tax=Punctularia strigosozonata (strain HHB-11173) TaxID=741275 RepID=UPI000441635D|nr:adhesion regulating molecule [Punctularia strigosozonata HHB-11173 SS5]EIN12753.1 adhesion regulating molecule [Punctularia strigosozonata HHB-11173 SS5]
MASENVVLAFKAGRSFRRSGTNFVDPDPTKGAILLSRGEDGLTHFQWKNRSTDSVEEDLILFPGDATFVKASGRTYVLKFSSSNSRHFFWMQDASDARDQVFVENVNRLLRDPDEIPIWDAFAQAPAGTGSTSAPQATPEQLAQLRDLVRNMTGTAAPRQPGEAELSLNDILTPANLNPLFTTHPALVEALYPHLPPDLPSPPSPEVLQQIIASPQFRAAVSNFDQALRTGMLGGLVRGLGLPEEAGTSVEAFLRAIQEQADRERGGEERMDTD